MSCCHAPRPEEIVRDVTVFFATTLYFTTQSSNRPRTLSFELPDGTSSLSAPNVSTPRLRCRICLLVYCSRSSGIQHHAWFDSGYVFLRQSHGGFGILFKEDLGSEVVLCFIADVEAESSTMLGSTVDTCSCVSPTISLAIRLSRCRVPSGTRYWRILTC